MNAFRLNAFHLQEKSKQLSVFFFILIDSYESDSKFTLHHALLVANCYSCTIANGIWLSLHYCLHWIRFLCGVSESNSKHEILYFSKRFDPFGSNGTLIHWNYFIPRFSWAWMNSTRKLHRQLRILTILYYDGHWKIFNNMIIIILSLNQQWPWQIFIENEFCHRINNKIIMNENMMDNFCSRHTRANQSIHW